MNSNAKRGGQRRGASTVEFAMTVPLVFLFFFASVEFGRVYMIRQSIENATYEAARRGLVPGTPNGEIRQTAAAVLSAVSVSRPKIRVSQNDEQVTVSVSVKVKDHAWITPLFFHKSRLSSTLTLNKDDA